MWRMLKQIWFRMQRIQQSRWFHLGASVLIIVGCATLFGVLLATSYDLDKQQHALEAALTDQSVKSQNEHALSLYNEGTVTLNGRVYGGPALLDYRQQIFNQDGKITEPRAMASLLLYPQIPQWAPRWLLDQPGTTLMLGIIITVWFLLIVWMDLTAQLILTSSATALAVLLALLSKQEDLAWGLGGLGILTFSFVMLTRGLLALLDWPNQALSVAHTVVKEASRTRLSLVFIVVLLIALPIIPMLLNDQDPLRFRVQAFISRSMGVTFVSAACLTLMLSCATIAFEIRDRQIWQLVSKPMSRLQYLVGKWIGVLGVNAVLLVIAGLSIFMYLQYLRTRPVAAGLEGQLDAIQLRDAVLTARVSAQPSYLELTADQLRERVDQEISRAPDLAYQEETPEMRRDVGEFLKQAYSAGQRTIAPGMVATYKFEGLGAARDRVNSLVLNYKFHILEDSSHTVYRAAFLINDQPPWVSREYVPAVSHNLLLGSNLVRDDGTMTIAIANLYEPPPNYQFGSLNFEKEDFEILYQVASFEGNFCRALLVMFTKLSFLATLGILFSTFLSFPVAVLASFTVFIGGTLSPFLLVSLHEFRAPPIFEVESFTTGQFIEWLFKSIVRWIGFGIVYTMGGFGEYSPTSSLVQGRFIPWMAVAWSALRLVVIWSIVTFVVGFMILRSRELATYSGQG